MALKHHDDNLAELIAHQLLVLHPMGLIGVGTLPLVQVVDVRAEVPLGLRTVKCSSVALTSLAEGETGHIV